ncbi:hypothetical protein Tco_1102712 [Tanacetum coccineum]
MPENKNPLEWFVRKVQDRIVLSTSRRSLVKAASKSRLSIEYEERDEMVVAHMVDGVDAFIKIPQGLMEPESGFPLEEIRAAVWDCAGSKAHGLMGLISTSSSPSRIWSKSISETALVTLKQLGL